MAQIQETPLDERQWRSPVALNNLQYFGGLHSKTVHLYFMESDFFDRTSNNWALFMQHKGEPWLTDRDQFELRLRAMQGLEFMVAAEPERRPDGSDTGIYVFRKQQRRKRPGHDDDLIVLGTYYLIGENIYQAASLEDIIGNKILAATTSLSKFFAIASSLPIYTSGRGYTYYPSSTSVKQTNASANASRRSSRAGSPTGESSSAIDMNDGPASSQNQPGDIQQSQKAKNTNAAAAATSMHALTQSFHLFNQYKDEFMDTNPIIGEPGSFHFSATARHIQQTQTKQAEAAAAAAAKLSNAGAADGTKTDSKPGTPALAASPDISVTVPGPSKKPAKIKRSKSRAGTAPTSPATPTAGATPGKAA
ncbi:mediator of rna polymerase ii transcription subunit 6 [Diplodia corticola]|uniref:Mediator of RNA polymerase II transcription subunit 6 n=1 Tax=Diplodia corticola TaxID=236234 RepID=A0A1J9R512_9PEZI|nr:mediator of rna polymerase ii transcription subunit 6 [Diplodia corticola]OJD36574.1 mediator of rna polymerase ii transcription subunit 6 [Diplodia corticola]